MIPKNTRVNLKKLGKNKSNKINKACNKTVRKTKKTGGKHKSKRARSNKKGGFRPFWRKPYIVYIEREPEYRNETTPFPVMNLENMDTMTVKDYLESRAKLKQ